MGSVDNQEEDVDLFTKSELVKISKCTIGIKQWYTIRSYSFVG